MSKNIIIVGAGGFGLEVWWLASQLGYNILGFLDDAYDKENNKENYSKPILGKVSDWLSFKDCEFVIAVGSPRTRKKIYDKMEAGDEKPCFATLVAPSFQHGFNVRIGEGSIICAGVVATAEVTIGKHCIINLNSTIGHECIIQDFVTIAPLVAISGQVHLENFVEIGTGAAIRQGLTVEVGGFLGMGGVLTKNMPQNTMFYGNPAKFIKEIN
ncbi:acetyltransferase [bacterium]|nr:acetyltransferase [bacterium]